MGNKQSQIQNIPKIKFDRFKKKTLSLLLIIFPEDFEVLEEIKYKKLTDCITKRNLNEASSLISIKVINLSNIRSMIKLSNSQIVTSSSTLINVWDLYRGQCITSIITLDTVSLLKINKNQIVSTFYYDNLGLNNNIQCIIKLWDLITKKCLTTIKVIHDKEDEDEENTLLKLNNTLIAYTNGKNIKLFDLQSKTCVKNIYAHNNIVNNLIKLNTLLFASQSTKIKIWNYKSGKLIREIKSDPKFSFKKSFRNNRSWKRSRFLS